MNSAGDRSVISNDMQELREGKEETSHKIQGHKANLSNPSKTPSLSLSLDKWMNECSERLLTPI